MSALRDLRAELVMNGRLKKMMAPILDELLTPLLNVRQTERFVVEMGWIVIGDYRIRHIDERPFKIMEVGSDVGQ